MPLGESRNPPTPGVCLFTSRSPLDSAVPVGYFVSRKFVLVGGHVDIQVRKAGDVTVLDLNGRLVLGEEAKLTATVNELFAAGERYLAVNLAGVPIMDSSGIGSVVRAHTSAVRAGGRCRFFAPTKMVMQTLRMVRLETLLELCEDESAALAGFQ